MTTPETRFLDLIQTERLRLRSRRTLFGAGAGAALAGVFGIAAFAAPRGSRTAFAQDFADDIEILNYALTLEHLEFAFYRDGLEMLGDDAFEADVLTELTAIRDHEGAHVDAIVETVTALGGEPVAEGTYDFDYEDAAGFLEVAMALENVGVAAYAGAAPMIADGEVLAAALGIHSVEARHAAYLNGLNGVTPFPDAVDAPMTTDEVLAAAGGFIVDEEASPEAAAPSEDAQFVARQLAFFPKSIEVPAGTTVTWTNEEVIAHTVVDVDGAFGSEVLGLGDSFTHTFEEAGTFEFFCDIHTGMRGEVIVS